jgi:O-methyltransferase involved in polyketide biosynthesis
LSDSPRSETATPSRDAYGLGQTPGQRGAEILAGFRAERMPSPETRAVARYSGRLVARILLVMLRNSEPLNFTLSRPQVIDHLIRRNLPEKRDGLVLVDVAAGLSPRGITLAREMPEVKVIEVDLPDVTEEKQRRLRDARNVDIPDNLDWRSGDMGVTPLTEILGDIQADIISAEGLVGYLKHDQIIKFGGWTREALKPGGFLISDIGLKAGIRQIQEVASFFSRQAGNWYGQIETKEEGEDLMQKAGFESAKLHVASDFIEELGLPTPLIDLTYFIEARKAKASL